MNGWPCDTLLNASAFFPPVAEEYAEAIPLSGAAGGEGGVISDILLCVLLYLALLATVQLRGRGVLAAACIYFLKRKNSEQLVDKKIAPNLLPLFFALCLSFFTLSLLVVYLVHGRFVPLSAANYLCFLLAYHFVLLGVIRVLGWVFNARDCAREVAINVWVYNTVPGIVLSPIILTLFYVRPSLSEALLTLTALLLAVYLILRLARWVKILFEHGVPIFYLILYLCALEILPLLVLYKMLAGSF